MWQAQRKKRERGKRRKRRGLASESWACGEEPYDCHLYKMGRYHEEKIISGRLRIFTSMDGRRIFLHL